MENNEGFSMVELIIVIAIMAILVGAIAPTLIKYVQKSRATADVSNADTIAGCVQEALVDKEVEQYIFDNTTSLPLTLDVGSIDPSNNKFEEFLYENLGGGLPDVKYKKNGATGFEVVVYSLNGSTNDVGEADWGVQILAKGASVSAGSPTPQVAHGCVLWPEPDLAYKQ
ncbi:MAG: type II secretion system protein [Lachnospiraceae bacterium]|nr:type II secretion system protein [Lachnospiraceae bacterium]